MDTCVYTQTHSHTEMVTRTECQRHEGKSQISLKDPNLKVRAQSLDVQFHKLHAWTSSRSTQQILTVEVQQILMAEATMCGGLHVRYIYPIYRMLPAGR